MSASGFYIRHEDCFTSGRLNKHFHFISDDIPFINSIPFNRVKDEFSRDWWNLNRDTPKRTHKERKDNNDIYIDIKCFRETGRNKWFWCWRRYYGGPGHPVPCPNQSYVYDLIWLRLDKIIDHSTKVPYLLNRPYPSLYIDVSMSHQID